MLDKADGAFLTIGELATELGIAQHVLRYWETRFPQLRPLTRAGNRRYYRPTDVVLVKNINRLLAEDGMTIKGAQKMLAQNNLKSSDATAETARASTTLGQLQRIRNRLAAALSA